MTLRVVLIVIGFTATVAQIILLRELLVIYYGNEISLGVILANWLIWVAFGSGVLGRFLASRNRPGRTLAILQLAAAISLPLTIISSRMVLSISGAVAGEILSPGTMFISSLLILSVFCSISGAMFAVGSRLYSRAAKTTAAAGTSSVYLLEALGAGIGGLLASLVMIRSFSGLEIAFLVCMVNFTSAFALIARRFLVRPYFWICISAIGFLGLRYAVPELDCRSLQMLWGDLEIIETKNSPYGNLTVIENEGSRTLYTNSLVAFASPDPEGAEESVHYALLQHQAPRQLLLIGGGVNGSLQEALKHKSLQRIDYVELDSGVIDVARRYFADNYSPLKSGSQVRLHETDGRLFLRFTSSTYDVIIVNLPDPKTAQLNRFYTKDFFEAARQRLNPGGLVSFQVTGGENYISNELAAFLACLHRTLQEVFREVKVFPGRRTHFFGSTRAGVLSADAEVLIDRLKSRSIQTQFVREYYLPFRLMPDRLQDLEQQLEAQNDTRINTDFSPIAYYFDMLFWSTRFHRGYLRLMTWIDRSSFTAVLSCILAASVLVAMCQLYWKKSTPLAACYSVWAMGFTLLALEILLLLGFQAIYGYVYHRLSLIVAFFMVGLTVGSWGAIRFFCPARRGLQLTLLFWLQMTAAVSSIFVCALLAVFAGIEHNSVLLFVSTVVFPCLAFLTGLMGGFQFPLVSTLYFSGKKNGQGNRGLIYGLDILGACSASLLLSIVFFPLYGLFPSSLIIAAINSGPLLLIGIVCVRTRRGF